MFDSNILLNFYNELVNRNALQLQLARYVLVCLLLFGVRVGGTVGSECRGKGRGPRKRRDRWMVAHAVGWPMVGTTLCLMNAVCAPSASRLRLEAHSPKRLIGSH